ncbi:MAG: acyl transferase [Sphingobacteriaceae bacterium]|nr:acyl transferase [Sphingobacteriaceae bacterium]
MNLPINANDIFSLTSATEFEEIALQVFRYQAEECAVYSKFVKSLGVEPKRVEQLQQIPFLPIEFFKSQRIVCGSAEAEVVFSSSGTTGMNQSRHYVSDVRLYEQSFREGFREFYGEICKYNILALLPSYSERDGSSLIYMVDDLIRESGKPASGYFLYNHDELFQTLIRLRDQDEPTVLIGVTFALLDFIEKYPIDFPQLIVMETGGMKGRRKEMIREELHQILCRGFGVFTIHSEYGMTELLSQAYSTGDGIFKCPGWMKVLIRDTNDPFTLLASGQTGGINVIDLANLNSCSFIATQDLGKLNGNGGFEVLGRFDNSDIRGCNLLVQ